MKRVLAFLLAVTMCFVLISCGGNQWQEQYDLGMKLLDEGKYEEAVLAFTKAIEIDDKNADAYLARGDAYMALYENETDPAKKQEYYDKAMADYEKAKELDPDSLGDRKIMVIDSASEGGRWPVKIDGKWGYIGVDGKLAIAPMFDEAGVLTDGLARVCKDGKWGYVDKSGKIAIEMKFDGAGIFSEGLAAVKISNSWGFIDTEGKYIAEPQFEEARVFGEGFAGVKKDGMWGFVDKSGKIAIATNFTNVGSFNNGLAYVQLGDGSQEYVDTAGNVISMDNGTVAQHMEGLTPSSSPSGKWGYMDKDGKDVFEYKFDEADIFLNGLARVKVSGKWGFIDESGNFVIEPKYDSAEAFVGELAEVTLDGKMGYINKSGEIVYMEE